MNVNVNVSEIVSEIVSALPGVDVFDVLFVLDPRRPERLTGEGEWHGEWNAKRNAGKERNDQNQEVGKGTKTSEAQTENREERSSWNEIETVRLVQRTEKAQ